MPMAEFMSSRRIQAAALASVVALTFSPADAQTVWTNPATGSWFDDGNWTNNQPTGAENATVSNGGVAQLVTGGTGQANVLTIGAPSRVEIAVDSTLILSNSAGDGSIVVEGGTLEATPGGGPTFATGITATAIGGALESADDQVTISGVISGNANSVLTIHDNGNRFSAIFLSGNNTFSGTLTIDHASVVGAAANVYGVGTLNITATGAADLGGYDQHVHDLEGAGFVVNRNFAGGPGSTRINVLTVDMGDFTGVIRDSSVNFGSAGVSNGIVSLLKTTSNTLTLGGTSTFAGPTEVEAGTLLIDGSIEAIATVDSGATLGGVGTIGGLVVQSGGTLAPGAARPYSTLQVAGNMTFSPGSTFAVNITPAGQTDAIAATGIATINGGTVAVNGGNGTYSTSAVYPILTAAGGRTGMFSNLTTTTNLAFLRPTLIYTANAVDLTLTRTVVSPSPTPSNPNPTPVVVTFPSAATTSNQRATAGAIEALGTGPLYVSVLSQTAAGAGAAFGALSGQAHASVQTLAVTSSRVVSDAILDRLWNIPADGGGDVASVLGQFGTNTSPALLRCYTPDPVAATAGAVPSSYTVWAQAIGTFFRAGGDGNASSVDNALGGASFGIDTRLDGTLLGQWRVGLAGGYTDDNFSVKDGGGAGDYQNVFGAVYGGARYGALDVKLGASYGTSSTTTHRSVAFPGFDEAERSITGGETVQGFGELGYRFRMQQAVVEPILDAGVTHVHQDSFREKGGVAALYGFAENTDVGFTTLGLRAEAVPFPQVPLVARLMLGWEHSYGDINPASTLAFVSGSAAFSVYGTPLDRDAAVTEADLVWRATPVMSLAIAYVGQIGQRDRENGLKGRIDYRF